MKNNAVEFGLDTISGQLGFRLSENTVEKIANATSTLFAPITAWLQGEAAKITVKYLPFYDKLAERKNQNLQNLAVSVLYELKDREDAGKEIPEKFEDTDNLLLIQDNASTTSNEEFLRLWAKIYTEEACKPGTISRKTIKLVETLDINIVKVLENDILPYCDENGFYWGTIEELTSIMLAEDYELIANKSIFKSSKDLKEENSVVLNQSNILYIYPGYGYTPKSPYVLTQFGLEIKNILNIVPKPRQIKVMIDEIEKSAQYWNIIPLFNVKLKTQVSAIEKFIICGKNKKIKYPKNIKYKTFDDFYKAAKANLEEVKNAK